MRNYIGGTDAAPILGLSRFKTPLQVWAEKTGQVGEDDLSNKLYIRLGNKLESTVADLFMEETGKKVQRVNETLFHPDYDFIGGNIDRRIVGEDAILECKSTSPWRKDEWENEDIPQEYIIQCMHYLAVTGKKKAYIAVLIGNQAFKYKEIERDENLIKEIIEREVEFWNEFIKKNIMPSNITYQDTKLLLKLFPDAKPETQIKLSNYELMELHSARLNKKYITNQVETMENKVKAKLGDNELGESDNFTITWKNQKRTDLDTEKLKAELPGVYDKFKKESETRYFRIKEKKGVDKNE